MTAGGFGPIGADRLRPDNLRLVQQPHLALREGDRDAMFLERIPQRQKHLPAHIGQAAGRVADPETQHIFDRTVAKAGDPADRPAAGNHPPHPQRGLDRDLADLVGIVGL